MQKFASLPTLLILWMISACQSPSPQYISINNTLAWCVVPFDAKERTPIERIQMLKELGFTQYAYDWRSKHLNEFADEIRLAKENEVEMAAVWLWIDDNQDSVGQLSPDNERLLKIIAENQLHTTIWMSFNGNFFNNLSHSECLQKGSEMVEYIHQRAQGIGCKLALYNHGDWFGDPRNQVEIIHALPLEAKVGIVYNFHHAHEQIDEFAQLVPVMLPYLWAVNLNGMKKEGPKILPLGQGNLEQAMVHVLAEQGFQGPWGILGHVETEDVRVVLERNIAGLKLLTL